MASQLALLPDPIPVPCPIWLCWHYREVFGSCPRQGRAVLGAIDVSEGSVEQEVRCQTCGASGVESTRVEESP